MRGWMPNWLTDWLWLFLLIGCVPAAADENPSVLRVHAMDSQHRFLGSAVVLSGQRIATVKHVVEDATAIAVEVGGVKYPVRIESATTEIDGAVILRGDFPALPGLQIASGAPPIGSEVVLWGYGERGRLASYAGTVIGGGEVRSSKHPRSRLLGNQVDAKRGVGGDSGGPAIDQSGAVVGLVMLGSEDGMVLSSWADLSAVVNQSGGSTSRNSPGEVLEIYTSPGCRPCDAVKADLRAGVFSSVGVQTRIVDVTTMRNPPVAWTPSFGFRGKYYTPEKYEPAYVIDWVKAQRTTTSGGSGTHSPPPVQPPVQPAIESIDWSGVRFGVLVSDRSPDFMSRLRAPVQRALDVASGNQVPIEIFREADSPNYMAVRDALGINHSFAVYPFMTLDKVADVGLVKGLVLKKLEAGFDGKLDGESNELLPDLIFRRTSKSDWLAVTNAMGVRSLNSGVPPPAVRSGSRVQQTQKSWAESFVAFIVGAFGAMKTVRSVRGFYGQQTEKLLEENSPLNDFFEGPKE